MRDDLDMEDNQNRHTKFIHLVHLRQQRSPVIRIYTFDLPLILADSKCRDALLNDNAHSFYLGAIKMFLSNANFRYKRHIFYSGYYDYQLKIGY